VPRQQTQESLQQRVNGILRGSSPVCAVEESMEETVEAISSLLQRAVEDLKAAQGRVNRLMRALEKARS
jgi:hypothetical protein